MKVYIMIFALLMILPTAIVKAETQSPGNGNGNIADNIQNTETSIQDNGSSNVPKYLRGVELFLLPAATFYGNAVGVDGSFGVIADMSYFGLDDFKKDIVAGFSGLWHRASKDDTTVSTFGAYGIAGYQVFLNKYISGLPWYEDARFIGECRIGCVDQDISGGSGDSGNGAAFFMSPALTADVKLPDAPLRLGLDISYNLYFGDTNLRTVSTGLFISYKF